MGPPFNFSFVFTLTSIHFLVTAIEMEIMAMVGLFDRTRLPWGTSAKMAVFCTGSVGLMNLSLKFNSVGFYQLCKLLGIPWLVFVERIVYKKHTSFGSNLSLIVILTGMFYATVADVSLSIVGSSIGIVAVMITTQYQIWQGIVQCEHKLSPLQINYAQALPTFFVCTIIALMAEFNNFHTKMDVLAHRWTVTEAQWIIFSAILAGFANLCSYGLIGHTSPITFQVVGHLKTILIIVGGHFLPHEQISIRFDNFIGITVCLMGAALYGYIRHAESTDDTISKNVPSPKFINLFFHLCGKQSQPEKCEHPSSHS
ncbi:unnamed protein product [Adineta ricciae]|uniref:Sugar phosphate transporter domain-containing protein n=1 Tax=Adineta ricciae TaxID=249248 RepID=A0A816C298_ADIRI|nr:unnamed protein product [Adineta ricciae]